MGQTGPDVPKAIVDAFQMWAGGEGHLDRHRLKCAYVTLHGTRPSRVRGSLPICWQLPRISQAGQTFCCMQAQLDSLMREAVTTEDADGPVLPWQAFAARMEVC